MNKEEKQEFTGFFDVKNEMIRNGDGLVYLIEGLDGKTEESIVFVKECKKCGSWCVDLGSVIKEKLVPIKKAYEGRILFKKRLIYEGLF